MRRRRPSDETLVTLRAKLEDLPARSAERQHLLQGCADLHSVSVATIYRALREQFRPPPAQRFQAEHVNECWQFDLSPSDLKQVPAPLWVEAGRGPPTLMLFSAVDDRSGVAYQEYRCVYGEDVAAALRFLFNAMSPKDDEPGLVLQGIPAMIYLDNGPVAKSGVFKRVMAQLGVEVRTHMPRGSDGRRVTARAKGKSLPRRRPGSSGRSGR